jgi:tRNA A37 N6-isopentenylltransferase MiaA
LSDKAKYNAAIANFGEQQLNLVDDIISDLAPTGLYETLKRELINRLSDSDSRRVEKLLEAHDLGDRTPSQLYRDMKKLATPAISDEKIAFPLIRGRSWL